MENKLKVVKAKESNYSEIAEIYMEAFSGQAYNETWTKELAREKLDALSKYCDFYIIKSDNEVAGFMILNPTKWFMGKTVEGEEFAIRGKFQGKGLAKFFLSEIEKIYKERGFESFIFIAHKNAKAFEYYKKMGYEESNTNAIFERSLK